MTPLINQAGVVAKKIPGHYILWWELWYFSEGGIKPTSNDAGTFGFTQLILRCLILFTKLSASWLWIFPICQPSRRIGKSSVSDFTSLEIIPSSIIVLMNSSELNPVGSQGSGIHPSEIWLSNPQGAPSGVWTGHTNPQASGKSFLTVVVFYSAK